MVGDRILTINGNQVHQLQDFIIGGLRTFGIMKKYDIRALIAYHAVLPGGDSVGSSAETTMANIAVNPVLSGGGSAGSLALVTSMKPNDFEGSESVRKKHIQFQRIAV